ncbi:MAG: hypothetical protein JSS75_12695 [Bacteroidetes bacterium]|nr:hypothetical protein [Bacteroidota bacterium]
MLALYGLLMRFVTALLPLVALFDQKLKRSVDGRRGLLETLRSHYRAVDAGRKRIVIHVSSFGELEQAKPIIKRLKNEHPEFHIHLTFFSASGYDNAKGKYAEPDLISYLPFDTRRAMRSFVEIVRPDLFIFVRYDVWHTLVDELRKQRIRTLLICATFDERKVHTTGISSLYRVTYSKLDAILAIRASDAAAIKALGVNEGRVRVAGDTRFDQVIERKDLAAQTEQAIPSRIIESWRSRGKTIVVAGSTWEPDEELIRSAFASDGLGERLALIVVPHEIGAEHIASLQRSFVNRAVLLSNIEAFATHDVIIVDSIGKLFALYRSADIAYVGGGFGAGVHNTLEAAVWGVPVLCGPRIERSREIAEMIHAGGAMVVRTATDLTSALRDWVSHSDQRQDVGAAAAEYVSASRGAITRVMEAIYEAS